MHSLTDAYQALLSMLSWRLRLVLLAGMLLADGWGIYPYLGAYWSDLLRICALFLVLNVLLCFLIGIAAHWGMLHPYLHRQKH